MTLLLDRYELGDTLGVGGMGHVVAAHDRRLERRVAVKLIREDLARDAAARRRLLREARSAARLQHPHSVAMFDAGEHEGRPFVVMELVSGVSLAQRLSSQGALSAEEATATVAAVLDALAAAHERGLVHRDVKPSNVLLPEDGGVKLADFGIAVDLADDATLTDVGQVLGSPRYLAPERATGHPATPASDIYSTGVMLYEALAGRAPFHGDHAVATLLAHQQQAVPPLHGLAPTVPSELAAVATRALDKDPGQRFASARSMHDALLTAAVEAGCRPDAAAATAPPATTGPLPILGIAARATSHEGSDPAHAHAVEAPGAVAAPPAGSSGPTRRRWLLPLGAAAAAVLLASGAIGIHDRGEVPVTNPDTDGNSTALAAPPMDGGAGEALIPSVDDIAAGDASDEETGAAEPSDADAPDPGDQDDRSEADGHGGSDEADASEGEDTGTPEQGAPLARDAAPGALDELIADIARDPAAVGTAGDRLLGDLQKLRETDDVKLPRASRRLLVEVGEHRRDDALTRDAGHRAAAVLEALGRPTEPQVHELSLLFADTAAEADRTGERGKQLLKEVSELLGEDDADKREHAADKLGDQIERWIDEERLDRERGRRTLELLAGMDR